MKNLIFKSIVLLMTLAVTVPAAGQTAWPDQAYRVDWGEARLPEEVAVNTRIAVPVLVRNDGNRVWPASQVFVAYHWFRDDHLVVWDGERTPMPHDLRAGSRVALAARVSTPREPGTYVLMLTLVHEQVTWFEHKGAATIVRPVTVRPATQSVDCGDSGSRSCQAAR